jgi:hypothetical protein
MSEATAPAFVLGAVAGFVSILPGQMTSVVARIRTLNDISGDDRPHVHHKSDLPRLLRRARLLKMAPHRALASAMCMSLLLASALLRVQHVYGAGLLFVIAVALPGVLRFKFGQEVSIGLSETDQYR